MIARKENKILVASHITVTNYCLEVFAATASARPLQGQRLNLE
jgi:hypothetical protein